MQVKATTRSTSHLCERPATRHKAKMTMPRLLRTRLTEDPTPGCSTKRNDVFPQKPASCRCLRGLRHNRSKAQTTRVSFMSTRQRPAATRRSRPLSAPRPSSEQPDPGLLTAASPYRTFWRWTENRPAATRGGGTNGTKEAKGTFGVKETFYILTVVITRLLLRVENFQTADFC